MSHAAVAVHAIGFCHHDVFVCDAVAGTAVGIHHLSGFQSGKKRGLSALQIGRDVTQSFLGFERQLGKQIVGSVTLVARKIGVR